MFANSLIRLQNPHIRELDVDVLYHFGLTSEQDMQAMFGDVKFVCMGGSTGRMEQFAHLAVKELGIEFPVGANICDISKSDRFCMYKVGPVLSISVSRPPSPRAPTSLSA